MGRLPLGPSPVRPDHGARLCACLLAAIVIAGRRDLDASVIADNDSAAPRLRLLNSLPGFTFRQTRGVLLGWLTGCLMLGVITHTTTDLSPIPLFWLIPLMLYLLSFILVFAKWPVVWTEKASRLTPNLRPRSMRRVRL